MAINREVELTNTDEVIIPVSRHNTPDYTIAVESISGVTVDVQVTLGQINRGDTATWADVSGLTGISSPDTSNIQNTPAEAFRIASTGTGTATVRLMQNT